MKDGYYEVLGFDSQEALKLGYFVRSVSQNNARGGAVKATTEVRNHLSGLV
ncbi:MAG: hypothetical protein WBL88_18670 [Nitrososphaeraceae archaeon]